MGLVGIGIGFVTEMVGIIKDDDELVKKGLKRMARGTATMIIGDVFGVSDTVEAVASAGDVLDA
jgi:hypothetical protein